MSYGISVKHDKGGKRLEIQCAHQSGLLYVVPSQASWVCDDEHLHAHALAGFFKDLVGLQSPQIKELMQRWGIYFRERPVELEEAAPTT
ncbi:MAG: hypothetical protein AAB303_00350 [Chloroflexota bacterium]